MSILNNDQTNTDEEFSKAYEAATRAALKYFLRKHGLPGTLEENVLLEISHLIKDNHTIVGFSLIAIRKSFEEVLLTKENALEYHEDKGWIVIDDDEDASSFRHPKGSRPKLRLVK